MTRDSSLKTVAELVGRFPGHKLTTENHLALWPCTWNRVGKFYQLESGWRLAGWGYPPYEGSAPTCLVFQLMEPQGCREPGYYWYHARIDERYWKPFKQDEKTKSKTKKSKTKI